MWQPTDTSFDRFVAELGPSLRHAFIAKYGPDVGSDVTSETLAYAWEHWRKVSSMNNPAGWLFRVGQSRSRRFFRRPVLLPPPEVSRPEIEPHLHRHLAQLSKKQRVAVLMLHAYGYTVRQTAELLDVAPSTVQRNADRGLANLRARLGVWVNV